MFSSRGIGGEAQGKWREFCENPTLVVM